MDKKQFILYAQETCRSQMAEGWGREILGEDSILPVLKHMVLILKQ